MPIDHRRKPTDAEFQDFCVYQKNLWAPAVTIWKEAQSYYLGKADIWADYYLRNPLVPVTSRPPFHPASFASKVDQIVSGHLAFEPKITRRPVADGKGHRDHADALEKGMQVLIHDSFSRGVNFPTKVVGKNIVLFHYSSAGIMLNSKGMVRPERSDYESDEAFKQAEWEWLSRSQHWNPIEVIVPAPGDVLMDYDVLNPPVALWKQTGTAGDLAATIMSARIRHEKMKELYPQFNDASTQAFSYQKDSEPQEFIHWYTAMWHGIWLGNGQNILWEPNMMGIQPFSHIWAGDLITPVDERFDLGNWARQAMMYKVIDEIVMDAQAIVADHNLLMRHAFTQIASTLEPAELKQQMAVNGYVNIDPKLIGLVPTPDALPQSFNHRQALESGIDRHTVSPIDAGFQDLRTETATGIAIKAENTSRQVQAPRVKMEHLFAEGVVGAGAKVIYHAHQVMDKREDGEDVPHPLFKEIGVGDARVRVADMEEKFYFQVSFSQTDLATRTAAIQEAILLKHEGAVGNKYLRKVAGIENEKEAEQDVWETMLESQPEFAMELMVQTARKRNLNELADKLQSDLDDIKLQRLQQESQQAMGTQPQLARNGNGRAP